MRNGKLSVIVPAYNEQATVALLARSVTETLEKENIPFDIVFVNDGSSDGTWGEIERAARKYGNVHGVCFDRNYGKDCALYAGLSAFSGDCAATMDCDLQHPPQTLITMYRMWQSGCDCVEGIKKERGDAGSAHGLCADIFYSLLSAAVGSDMRGTSDFKLLDRSAAEKILAKRTHFYRAAPVCAGIHGAQTEYAVAERAGGNTKWSFTALVKYMLFALASVSHAALAVCITASLITAAVSVLFYAYSHYAAGVLFTLLFVPCAACTALCLKKPKRYGILKTI